jgi:hypothetical protein
MSSKRKNLKTVKRFGNRRGVRFVHLITCALQRKIVLSLVLHSSLEFLQGVKSRYFRLGLATTQLIPAASQVILAAGQLILGATSLTSETLFCRTTPFLQEKPSVRKKERKMVYFLNDSDTQTKTKPSES